MVRDKAGLYFLMNAILSSSPNGYFPVEELYRLWSNNRLGQLSWIGQLVMYPDLFCFGDYPHRALSTSCLKIPPDETNKDICNWLSLDLLKVLLQLAEDYHQLVGEILIRRRDSSSIAPAINCPDLLLLGIVQVGLPFNTVLTKLVSIVISQLMLHHTNAVSVLNALWNTESLEMKKGIQNLVVNGLLSFYNMAPDDTGRLTKILEIAHELKPNGLGELFNVQNFQFAIDLACLASRRDFLKLDKFLSDKLQEHTEAFANQLVNFIMRRYPAHIVTHNIPPLSHETFQLMYHALQNRAQYSNSVHSEFQKLQAHLKNAQNAAKPADPHINSRTPIAPFLGQSSTNQYNYGRGIEQPGVLNGSMTTPVFGTAPNGRPVGASTPTTPYSYPTSQLMPGSMDMRGQLTESMYRSGMASGPPGWNNPTSGWSSRSTPIPNIADFRPAFAQQSGSGASTASSQALNGAGILTDPRYSTETPNVEQFSDEIQDEANSYFQQMFTDHNPLSVQDFIKQMYQFRNSENPKYKKILNCVIKNLFDEFKFFNEYPPTELRTTAEVYGRFINDGIVEDIQFAQAVRKVIEAIMSPPNSPLFTFGVVALEACKSLLHRYPKVCLMIAQNESFVKFPPDLYDYIHAGCTGNIPMDSNNMDPTHQSMMHHGDLRSRNTPVLLPNHVETVVQAAQNAVMRIQMAATGPSMMAVSNTEILEKGTERDGEKVVLSEKKLAEEVSFLCNNLSFANLPNKVDDLRQILDKHDDTCRKWLAQYLVMKRITLEQNFHSLYNSFLVALNDEKLNHYVKQETLRNIKILLKSDKKHDTSSFDDRQLLKNLGHWLGLITIGRNYPVVLDELNLRDLLLEAFYKGQQELLYVIPFVVKIIMASPKSTVFSPSCAWVQQILHILAEIHRQSDLKLSLKFEIEVLCKELRVDLQSLVSDGSLLTDDRITAIPQQLSDVQSLTRPTDAASAETQHFASGPYDPAGRASTVQPAMYPQQRVTGTEGENAQSAARYQQTNAQAMPTPQFYYHDVNIFEPIDNQLTIPSNLPLFQIFPPLANQCRKVIAAAVGENLGGMVERSVTYAISLTSEIINKDFAQCPDPQQMRKAYLQMMRSITAAIGMITTKELLSATITAYLKNIVNHQIQHFGEPDKELIRMADETMVHILEKNIELACCYVVKTACEKAMIEIDKRMEDSIQRRKNGMKLEISPEVQAVIDKIPAELRPIDRLIKDSEMSVYNVFSVQMFGFKPSPIDDFGIDRNIYMKKKEEYHDIRQHVNENALDDMLSDPTFFQSKAESIFREWMTICSQTDIRTNQPFGNHLFTLMQNHGIAINEENILKQIKTCLEICTDVSYRLLSRVDNSPITANVRNRCYYTIDPFSKLVCLLIRNAESISNTNKLQLLHRTLSLLTSSLLTDHDVRRREFNGLPFLRIFITMIKDLCQHDPTIIQYHWNIIESFGQALYNIQPRRVPAFAFHWLEIIGHRVFITELLADPNAPHLTRAMYTQLLLAHLKFLAPSLRNVILPKAVQDLYRGTLRVMLVVLHDFPELLCEFYYVFCDVIPPNCVQLRNLVLSAFPRNMKLPDPFGQNFSQAENIDDMDIIPKVAYEMFNLIPEQLRNPLDAYLTNRLDVEFLLDLSNKLESSNISGSKYNVPVLNAIVNFVGIRAITQLKESNIRISISSIAHSSYMDVFQNLAITFCTEGRYLLFNALANQLRYPNAQTHYFACTILYLFKEATTDAIREQITRILFERLVSSRPHPWGLLITFIELVRNEQYKFWSYEFVHCAPEIERSVKSFTNNIAKKQSTDVVDYS
jgi:hypothetical protein